MKRRRELKVYDYFFIKSCIYLYQNRMLLELVEFNQSRPSLKSFLLRRKLENFYPKMYFHDFLIFFFLFFFFVFFFFVCLFVRCLSVNLFNVVPCLLGKSDASNIIVIQKIVLLHYFFFYLYAFIIVFKFIYFYLVLFVVAVNLFSSMSCWFWVIYSRLNMQEFKAAAPKVGIVLNGFHVVYLS